MGLFKKYGKTNSPGTVLGKFWADQASKSNPYLTKKDLTEILQEIASIQNELSSTITYLAEISQVGTNAPVVNVFKNQYEKDILWTRYDVGEYRGTPEEAIWDEGITGGRVYTTSVTGVGFSPTLQYPSLTSLSIGHGVCFLTSYNTYSHLQEDSILTSGSIIEIITKRP